MDTIGWIVAVISVVVVALFVIRFFSKSHAKPTKGKGGGVTPKPTDESIETKILD